MAARSLVIGRQAREFLNRQDRATVEHLLDVFNALRNDPEVDGVTKRHLLMLPIVQRLWSDAHYWIRYTYEPDLDRVRIHEIGTEPG